MSSSPDKKKTEKQSQVLLPYDVLVSCLGLISRLYYPTLSLVSRSFRSLIASPELYETRSSLNRTESCLYVCFQVYPDLHCRWFTLCRKPDTTLNNDNDNKKKSSGYVLAPVSNSRSPLAHWSGLVVVGSDIYNIGGPVENVPSSRVLIMDCRSNTWREGPSMLVARNYPVASVFDGKIYVVGGCKGYDFNNSMEVFDPKTQIWDLVSSPLEEIRGYSSRVERLVGFDGKKHIFGNGNGFVYKPMIDKWERMGLEMDWNVIYCVIENVLYYYYEGDFLWYDTEVRCKFDLIKGVKGLPKFANCCIRMADFGGKMAVLWEKMVGSSGNKKKKIWCAVIALERRSSEEIWGKVEWFDEVLTNSKAYSLEYALSATV